MTLTYIVFSETSETRVNTTYILNQKTDQAYDFNDSM